MKNNITTHSLEETLALGAVIGSRCRGGEVFELMSDLGGGKTAFVRGLVKGLGSEDEVSSPSFTINNTYQEGKYRVEHFDFYRLEDAGLMKDELQEDIFQDDTVVAVEWGDIVAEILPSDRVMVRITAVSDDERLFTFETVDSNMYLFDGVTQ